MNEKERRAAIESLYDITEVTIGNVKFKFKKEIPIGKIWEVKNQFIKRIKENPEKEKLKIEELSEEEKEENSKQNLKSVCFILSVLSVDGFTSDEFLEMHQEVVNKLFIEIKSYVFPNLEKDKENTEKKKSMILTNQSPSIT